MELQLGLTDGIVRPHERAYNDSVSYQRLCSVHVVLGHERPLRHVGKVPNASSLVCGSQINETLHDPYDIDHEVLYAHSDAYEGSLRKEARTTVLNSSNEHATASIL